MAFALGALVFQVARQNKMKNAPLLDYVRLG
jgi:hypothetical protein